MVEEAIVARGGSAADSGPGNLRAGLGLAVVPLAVRVAQGLALRADLLVFWRQ